MAIGDHLRVWRGAYWHHAIDLGNGEIAHYTGTGADKLGPKEVRRQPYSEFAKPTDQVELVQDDDDDCAPPEEVARRALSKLGERAYGVLQNNCEHFCTWCKTGTPYSWQAFKAGMVVGAAASPILLRQAARNRARSAAAQAPLKADIPTASSGADVPITKHSHDLRDGLTVIDAPPHLGGRSGE